MAGVEGEGDQPSRFVGELGVEAIPMSARRAESLTLTALVAELRRAVVDPTSHPAARLAASERLARLADAHDDRGRPLAPSANPEDWWGRHGLSTGGRVADPVVRLSGSQVGTLLACPRQWFLARRASADASRTSSAGFGTVVHTIAEHAMLEHRDPVELADRVDRVWQQIPFDAPWLSDAERAAAQDALERLAVWNDAVGHREVVGVEVGFTVPVSVAGHQVELSGTVDRLDRDSQGRLHIVDFKTSRSVATRNAVAALDQLGVYQLAARLGAFQGVAPGAALGGAELVYLRHPEGAGSASPKVLRQASLDERPYLDDEPALAMLGQDDRDDVGDQRQHETWVHHRLAAAARVVARERFVATRGPSCQWCPFAGSCPAQPQGRQVLS